MSVTFLISLLHPSIFPCSLGIQKVQTVQFIGIGCLFRYSVLEEANEVESTGPEKEVEE